MSKQRTLVSSDSSSNYSDGRPNRKPKSFLKKNNLPSFESKRSWLKEELRKILETSTPPKIDTPRSNEMQENEESSDSDIDWNLIKNRNKKNIFKILTNDRKNSDPRSSYEKKVHKILDSPMSISRNAEQMDQSLGENVREHDPFRTSELTEILDIHKVITKTL